MTKLWGHLKGINFQLYNSKWSPGEVLDKPLETFTINEFNFPSLRTLQRIARNEASNVTGKINTKLYPDINDFRVLCSLRDLVRQCVIVGIDESSECGGYRCPHEKQDKERVYTCDLAALQFQKPFNSGRLVLVQENEEEFKGILDDFIYENVVGEKRRPFPEISSAWKSGDDININDRYLPHHSVGGDHVSCFFDKKAYTSFVRQDVILSGLGVYKMVKIFYPEDKVNFKFLKYGTGFFGGDFAPTLEKLILPAVLDGVEVLQEKYGVSDVIKCVELPFYASDTESDKRIQAMREKHGMEVRFSTDDALKKGTVKGLLVATTNCGDNHAVCGNDIANF